MAIQFRNESEFNQRSNQVIKDLVLSENVKVVFKLEQLIKERNLLMKDLAEITGIRAGTLSDYAKGNPAVINSGHLLAMITALRITDISELLEIQMDSETADRFTTEKEKWKDSVWRPTYKKRQ